MSVSVYFDLCRVKKAEELNVERKKRSLVLVLKPKCPFAAPLLQVPDHEVLLGRRPFQQAALQEGGGADRAAAVGHRQARRSRACDAV